MDSINWVQTEGKYSLHTLYGEATITEVACPASSMNVIGSPQYLPRFDHSDGDVSQAERPFDRFEDAEGWLLFGIVMEIDQPREDSSSVGRLISTLDFCQGLLPDDIHSSHFKRVELIKQILRGEPPLDTGLIPPSPTRHLDWQQQDDKYYANTDHGRAIIIETRDTRKWTSGGTAHHEPRIEHPTGIAITGPSSIDFEVSETWIINKLNELNHPVGGEADLDNLHYTLQICAKVLPEDSNPLHYLRLEWMGARIDDILL